MIEFTSTLTGTGARAARVLQCGARAVYAPRQRLSAERATKRQRCRINSHLQGPPAQLIAFSRGTHTSQAGHTQCVGTLLAGASCGHQRSRWNRRRCHASKNDRSPRQLQMHNTNEHMWPGLSARAPRRAMPDAVRSGKLRPPQALRNNAQHIGRRIGCGVGRDAVVCADSGAVLALSPQEWLGAARKLTPDATGEMRAQ